MAIPSGWTRVQSTAGDRWYQHESGAVVRWLSRKDPILVLPRSGWVAWPAQSQDDNEFVGVFATMSEAMQMAMEY
jgi:hypothetical protein